MTMNLYQLRYFLEVARELSFTRAADNLHISPPAISRSVQLLERSVRRKLFSRTKRSVTLTTDGEFLKSRVERVFDEIERTKLELEEGQASAPSKLKIGSREMITNYLFPRPLLHFKERFPHTRFGIYELEPKIMADALKKDRIDFGFYYSDIPDPGLEPQHLGRIRSHIYASRRLLPRGRRPVTLRKLLGYPFIAPKYFQADPSTPSPDGFPDHLYLRNIQYECEFLETHRRFILDGVAVGVLPDLVIREEWKRGRVVQLKGPPIFREIYFFKRRGRPLSKAVDFFIAKVRRAIRRIGG